MLLGIIFDVILWIAAITLFILSATTPSFMFFILGLLCLLLAVVLLCIMTGSGSGSSLIDDVFDFID
jgi:hypothetical protein